MSLKTLSARAPGKRAVVLRSGSLPAEGAGMECRGNGNWNGSRRNGWKRNGAGDGGRGGGTGCESDVRGGGGGTARNEQGAAGSTAREMEASAQAITSRHFEQTGDRNLAVETGWEWKNWETKDLPEELGRPGMEPPPRSVAQGRGGTRPVTLERCPIREWTIGMGGRGGRGGGGKGRDAGGGALFEMQQSLAAPPAGGREDSRPPPPGGAVRAETTAPARWGLTNSPEDWSPARQGAVPPPLLVGDGARRRGA